MQKPEFHCGFVALLGRPNVGKSTLLNALVGERLAPVSPKAQTTRKRLRGIRTDEDSQIIFVDTPGVHKASGIKINEFFVSEAMDVLKDADAIVYIIDGSRPYKALREDSDERFLLDSIKKAWNDANKNEAKKKPLFVLLNKQDIWEKGKFLEQKTFQQVMNELPITEIFPIAAKTGKGLDLFLKALKKTLPVGPALYPEDELTDQNLRELVGELIQEKLFYFLGDELPYSCAVEVEKYEDPKGNAKFPEIHASIHVERESQKPMVIGKGGAKIKEIGQSARESMERLLGQKIVLRLFVKVTPKWTKNAEQLKQFGYAIVEK